MVMYETGRQRGWEWMVRESERYETLKRPKKSKLKVDSPQEYLRVLNFCP